jgi:dTDP-4-amino-4,6-dideoxygalactose transaminase
MEPIGRIAARRGIPIVEDAAQAIGAAHRGRPAGSFGALACFSFFPSKNLGAFGDAGLVATNDGSLAHEVRLLRNHGMEPKYVHKRVGGNFRLDALQAAVLRVKAPHLAAWTDGRRRNAERYRALFSEYGVGAVTMPIETGDSFHVYNQFVIRGPRRDELRSHLETRQIGTEIYYPIPLHRQDCFTRGPAAGLEAQAVLPHADEAAATSLALPIFAELTEEQQRHVVASIAEFHARHR